MDILSIILACLGSTGLFTFITFLINRKDKKCDDLSDIRSDLCELKAKSGKRDIEISKLLLSNLIQHNPNEHQPILYEARHYFVELGADSWMYDKISKWAEKENVDISWINDIENKR